MLRRIGMQGGSVFGLIIVVLAMSMCTNGCGGEKEKSASSDKKSHQVVVRTPKSSFRPATPVPPQPVIEDTTVVTREPDIIDVATPEPPREVTYEEAEAAYMERRYVSAVALFKEYVARKSENPWGYYMLGLSAWKTEDFETAEAAFGTALELDPEHVKSYLNLSRVLLDTHRPQDALAHIEHALSLDPESNVACRLQGRAYRQLGQTDDAIAAYRRAIELDNDDAWSMNNLALIFVHEERFEDAVPPLARAVEIKGDEPIFLNNLGMALEGTGHFRAAEDAYRSAVSIDESYFKAGMNLARVEEVLEETGLEPIDLEIAAQRFVDGFTKVDAVVGEGEPCSPGETMTASESTESGSQTGLPEPAPTIVVVSEPDSTIAPPEQ